MTFSSRWKAVKRLRSNFALVLIGCVLVLLAVSWRLAIAPALEVVPTNIDQHLFYDGTLTTFVNPPGQPVVGSQAIAVPVHIDRRVFSKPIESTPSIAVMETDATLIFSGNGETLSSEKHVYTLDRETAKMVRGAKADRDRSGYYLLFPYDTPKGTLPLWSEPPGKAYQAKYGGSQKLDGVNVYEFVMSYGIQPLAGPPRGYPEVLTGAQLKQILSMPGLGVADGEQVRPYYTVSASVSLKVEPRSGTIVGTGRSRESVSLTVKGASGDLLVTRVLSTLEYTQTPVSVASSAADAKDQLTKLRLQFLYIPLGLLVISVAAVLTGFFAGVKRGSES